MGQRIRLNRQVVEGDMTFQKPSLKYATLAVATFGILAPAAGSAMVLAGGLKPPVYPGFQHDAQVRGEPSEVLLRQHQETTEGDGDRESTPVSNKPVPVSETVTVDVVSQLSNATQACQALTVVYRTDCLANELEALVEALPVEGEYEEARKALSNASQELSALSRQNRDNNQPRLKVTVMADPQTVRRPVAAVQQETVEQTNAKALAVLEDTTTVLLRSAEGNSGVAVHYQRIAQALDSTKLLLRS